MAEPLDARLLEILVCPVDKEPLLYLPDEATLYNPRRRLRYRIDDGIPVMLVDEATEVGDDAEHDRLVAAEGAVTTGGGPAGDTPDAGAG